MPTTAPTTTVARRLPLVALLAANAVSLVGSMLTVVALPWFVLETTGSAARAGITGFFVLLPGTLAGILGGAAIDRLGFKRASVLADVVSGSAIAGIPLLYQTVGLAFWQLLLLVFLGNLLDVPGLTARRSLLPDLAMIANARVERVNAVYEANQRLALLLGPPIAGILVTWLGASNVIWIDASTSMISAIAIAVAVPQTWVRKDGKAERYLEQVAAGLRFLRDDRLLLAFAAGLGASNLFVSPLFAVVAPVYARQTLDSATNLGLMFSAFGLGGLIGTLAYGMFVFRLPRRAVWLMSFLVLPVIYWVLMLEPPLVIIMLAYATVGLLTGPSNPLALTVRHERIPPHLRGRVFATFSAVTLMAGPIGVGSAGFLIEQLGFVQTVLALAAGGQLLGIGMLFVPALRELGQAGQRAGDVVDGQGE